VERYSYNVMLGWKPTRSCLRGKSARSCLGGGKQGNVKFDDQKVDEYQVMER
jgi:hypothetical protein